MTNKFSIEIETDSYVDEEQIAKIRKFLDSQITLSDWGILEEDICTEVVDWKVK